ncbi:MAG: hypothetical protein Fur0022_37860 [Anaerolineales bacterium]
MPKLTSAAETKDTYYWQHREEILLERKKRYRENEAYREMTRRRARERYHTDQEYRMATYQRARERYFRQKAQAESETLRETQTP